MAQVGLTKAAELTGKSPSTITRRSNHKENRKRLGFTINNDGEKLYDIAELERVFGTLSLPQKQKTLNIDAIERTSANANERNGLHAKLNDLNEDKIALLQDKIALLQTQLDDIRQDRDEWREQAKQSTRLLEDRRDKNQDLKRQVQMQENIEESIKVKKSFWSKFLINKSLS